MEINVKTNANERIIAIKGRLDTLTAPELQPTLLEAVKMNKKTVLDCYELEYVSSAGLRVLLMAEKSAKAGASDLIIRNVSAEIREIFDMTGFSGILTIE
ncbi:MAG: STAS domain-containing protein [Clostridiales Family XIII bacterium]|nr:STAS domain-containing protein [Clostridiales Family XIII bacterium]